MITVLKFQTLLEPLSKWPRQTAQTQIILLLKKQSDQGLPCLLFLKAFVSSSPEKQHIIENRKIEVFEIQNIYLVNNKYHSGLIF